jgi:chaperone BCS1
LSGIPGSGKTSLIKAICNEIGYNLSILSMSKDFNNTSLLSAMTYMIENSVLLLEDVDSLFEKRDATFDNPSITFSNFLNILDGVLYKHGCIIFLTTNHPEKLDHALLRIGRVDMFLEFSYPAKNDINRLFFDIMKKEDKDEFNKFYDNIKDNKIPMSAIVNFLFLHKTEWEKNISELLDTNNFIKKVLKADRDVNMYS